MKQFHNVYLFFFLLLVSIILLIERLIQKNSIDDIEISTTPFYSFAVTLCFIITMIYLYLFRKKTPISITWGLIHFATLVSGLYLTHLFYEIIYILYFENIGEFVSYTPKTEGPIYLVYLGPILLLISLVIFAFGLVNAVKNKDIPLKSS